MFRHAVWTHGGGFARRAPKKLTLRWCGERSSPIRGLVAIWHASVYRGLSAALTRTKLSLLSTSEHEGGGKKLSVDTENTKSLIGDGDKKYHTPGFLSYSLTDVLQERLAKSKPGKWQSRWIDLETHILTQCLCQGLGVGKLSFYTSCFPCSLVFKTSPSIYYPQHRWSTWLQVQTRLDQALYHHLTPDQVL